MVQFNTLEATISDRRVCEHIIDPLREMSRFQHIASTLDS
jgi:hypothetical protein